MTTSGRIVILISRSSFFRKNVFLVKVHFWWLQSNSFSRIFVQILFDDQLLFHSQGEINRHSFKSNFTIYYIMLHCCEDAAAVSDVMKLYKVTTLSAAWAFSLPSNSKVPLLMTWASRILDWRCSCPSKRLSGSKNCNSANEKCQQLLLRTL